MKKITITVTKKDIAAGRKTRESKTKPFPCDTCPVSLATQRAIGPCAVGQREITLPGCLPRIKLPIVAQEFIERFDAGKAVKPFRFTITK